MRIIDLSAPIAATSPDAAPFERIEIRSTSHAEGAAQVRAMLGVPPELLRHGEGWAIEEFTRLGTHSVTHVDAPWHYNSTIQGQPAATIDDLPLEWFFSDGVVLDMHHKGDGEKVLVEDVEATLAAIDYTLKPLDIVLMRTGRDAFYGQPDYVLRGCAVSPEATRWLYDQGVRVMGIDAWGWDGPLDRQAREALARQEPGVFWAAHQCDRPYSQIERLVNLGSLPPFGFKVACFPLKIRGGSAGPARVVAILADCDRPRPNRGRPGDVTLQGENQPMKQSIGQVALVVRDYDEAIDFYVDKLGFNLIEDTYVPEQDKRWVVVAPPGASGSRLLLARAVGEEQSSRIGNQTGGRVFLFLYTDDFWRDYHAYRDKGVLFVREPKEHPYGIAAVFSDLYGNLWDLVQLKG